MGCNRVGKVTIVVNNGIVVIGKVGSIDPTSQETTERGAGSSVFTDQVRDIVNDVRDEVGSIELPKRKGTKSY